MAIAFFIEQLSKYIDHSILITTTNDIQKNILLEDPNSFFEDDIKMNEQHIIASGSLGKQKIDGKIYFYPHTSYVCSSERGKGYGSLLYILHLAAIKHLSTKLKTKPMFAQHNAMACGINPITYSAARLYPSLEKMGYIKLNKEVDVIVSIESDSMGPIKLLKWTKAKSKIFDIVEYPSTFTLDLIDEDKKVKIFKITKNL